MRAVENLGIHLAAVLMALVTGLAMIVVAAPVGVMVVTRDALKSHA